MKSAIQQFYALLREAMFINRITASDISQNKGVHYTYVYNQIRKNGNVTLETAESLAAAAGYRLVIKFEALDDTTHAPLVGNMDSTGPLYSERRTKTAIRASEAAAVEAEVAAQPDTPALDAELAELLALGGAA